MAKRKKIYYTPSEINNNIFTPGKELMIFDTWENYIGYYHSYNSTGEVFTEPEWHPIKSKLLVQYKEKPRTYFQYVDITQTKRVNGEKTELVGPIKMGNYSAPIPVLRIPTSNEVRDGIMTRHFVIKRNEKNSRMPVEIDKSQAKGFSNAYNGINQYLYELVDVPWKIDGPEFDIFSGNFLKIPGVVDTNKRIVNRFSKKFPILRKVLTNFREFSIYNTTTV